MLAGEQCGSPCGRWAFVCIRGWIIARQGVTIIKEKTPAKFKQLNHMARVFSDVAQATNIPQVTSKSLSYLSFRMLCKYLRRNYTLVKAGRVKKASGTNNSRKPKHVHSIHGALSPLSCNSEQLSLHSNTSTQTTTEKWSSQNTKPMLRVHISA
jgi:hypothetical protein